MITLRKFLASAVVCFASFHVAAAPQLITGDTGLLGADGINVSGTLYNVRFVEGTCESVFAGCTNFAFDGAGTQTALQALISQVFTNTAYDLYPTATNGCGVFDLLGMTNCGIISPYSRSDDSLVLAKQFLNTQGEGGNFVLDKTIYSGFDTFNDGSGPVNGSGKQYFVYAKWERAQTQQPGPQPKPLPEPSSYALFAAAFMGLMAARRRPQPKRMD